MCEHGRPLGQCPLCAQKQAVCPHGKKLGESCGLCKTTFASKIRNSLPARRQRRARYSAADRRYDAIAAALLGSVLADAVCVAVAYIPRSNELVIATNSGSNKPPDVLAAAIRQILQMGETINYDKAGFQALKKKLTENDDLSSEDWQTYHKLYEARSLKKLAGDMKLLDKCEDDLNDEQMLRMLSILDLLNALEENNIVALADEVGPGVHAEIRIICWLQQKLCVSNDYQDQEIFIGTSYACCAKCAYILGKYARYAHRRWNVSIRHSEAHPTLMGNYNLPPKLVELLGTDFVPLVSVAERSSRDRLSNMKHDSWASDSEGED